MESHVEELGYAAVHTCCVGYQKHEGNDGSCHSEALAAEARAEEVGHGARVQVLGHQFGALAQNEPCQQRTDDGVANANPRTCQSVFPSELTCVAHKDYC